MSHWDEVTAHVEHRVTFSETDGLGFAHHRCVVVWFEQARETFEEFQSRVDDRLRQVSASFKPWQELEEEVKQLRARVAALEAKLDGKA